MAKARHKAVITSKQTTTIQLVGNILDQNNMIKKTIFLIIILIAIYFYAPKISANSAIDSGLNYLKSKQDPTGKINTGFSAPSQWASIAFSINGIDVSTVKNPEKSLKDFLLSNAPSDQSSSTDWENRILSIVAIGEDPINFGGVNYVQKLESFYNNNQIGDVCSLNDDIFGLLALIAAKDKSTTQIKQDVLNFLIQKQDSQDGGFGFSAPGCDWYSTSSDITGAAIQALQAAKKNNLNTSELDNAIAKAKDYLLTNQNSDGGFGYYGSSDPDTTGWVIMAFNVLELKDTSEMTRAKNWLLTLQSQTDGGFQAFDWGENALLSNATTTAQSIIALSGFSWIYHPVETTITPTPSISESQDPTPTPSTSSGQAPTPTVVQNTPTPTPTNSCQDSKPESAPTITSAEISNSNEVILNWTKANGSVTYYSVAYGTSQDIFEYGAPNIGNQDTISYTVGFLSSRVTYYFKVRAGNGCTPGDFSNTAIVTIDPQENILKTIVETTPTSSSESEVLGETTRKINTSNTILNNDVIESESDKNSTNPNRGLMGFSALSFIGAIGYWYLKLRI
jgi:hypothetical protein